MSDAIEYKLVKDDMAFEVAEGGVMLKPDAKSKFLQSKFQFGERKEQVPIHNNHSINVSADDVIVTTGNSGQILNKSSLTGPAVSDHKNQPEKKSWFSKAFGWVWEQIKKPLGAALATATTLTLAWLLSQKGCTQTGNPTQYQSPIQQNETDTSSNKGPNSLDTLQQKR